MTSFARDGQALDSTANPARWRRLIVDGFGVVIRLESDALLRCRRMTGTHMATARYFQDQELELNAAWCDAVEWPSGDVLAETELPMPEGTKVTT